MSALENFEKEMEAVGDRMFARIDRELDELYAELTPQFEALAAKVENSYQEYEDTSNAVLERLRNELDDLGLLMKRTATHSIAYRTKQQMVPK